MKVLVLESSTSSAKSMVLDTETSQVIVKGNRYSQSVMHDPQAMFKELMRVGSLASEGQSIDMISLGGTWHSMMICDRQMHPISPLFDWQDTEASLLCKNLRKDFTFLDSYYHDSGCMVHAIYPFFKLMLLSQQGELTKDQNYCGQGTYAFYQLTGRWKETDCMLSGSGLLNTNTKEYLRSWLSPIGVDSQHQLGPIVRYSDTSPLSAHGARLLDLAQGIPVIPSLPDGALNQVGSDALTSGIMTISLGTSGAMRLSTSEPRLSEDKGTWCYLSPKGWLAGAATSCCANCIDWYKDSVFGPTTTYAELEHHIDGSRDVPLFLPFLFGERCPGWNDDRKAMFLDVNSSHTALDLYQSVAEGMLYNMNQCFLQIKKMGVPIDTIKLSGGLVHSPELKQMCIDIFGVDMQEEENMQTSLYGGAVLASELAHSPIRKKMIEPKILKPNMVMHEVYMQRFQRYLYWYEKTLRE